VPLATDLETNELAINWADSKAFTKDAAGNIISVPLGGGSGLTWSSVPASATATGVAGSISYDSQYQYICVSSNKWQRISLLGPFTPANISGLELWLDAADAWSLFDATSGGSVVAADGGVARWEDKSGNNRHFTQATSGKRPTRKTNQQNGLDALLFDGSNDCLDGGDFIKGASGLTIFCVLKRANTSASHRLLHKIEEAKPGWALGAVSGGAIKAESYADAGLGVSTIVQTSSAVDLSGFSLLQTTIPAAAFGSTTVRRNASAVSMNSAVVDGAGAATPGNSTALLLIGSNRYAGVDYNVWNGNISELLIYTGALPDTDRSAVESYLIKKYAIT
jgi:hypothetical protein